MIFAKTQHFALGPLQKAGPRWRERKSNKQQDDDLSLKQISFESVKKGMILQVPLSRIDQLSLNGRAILRDLASGDFRKMSFHLRGFYRALKAV